MGHARIVMRWLLFLLPTVAFAAPPDGADPALHGWYQSLQDPVTGGSCCGAADCRHFPTSTYTDPDGKTHYRVHVGDAWLPVPDNAILERVDNPTGEIVTCVNQSRFTNGIPAPAVLCLVRAPGT